MVDQTGQSAQESATAPGSATSRQYEFVMRLLNVLGLLAFCAFWLILLLSRLPDEGRVMAACLAVAAVLTFGAVAVYVQFRQSRQVAVGYSFWWATYCFAAMFAHTLAMSDFKTTFSALLAAFTAGSLVAIVTALPVIRAGNGRRLLAMAFTSILVFANAMYTGPLLIGDAAVGWLLLTGMLPVALFVYLVPAAWNWRVSGIISAVACVSMLFGNFVGKAAMIKMADAQVNLLAVTFLSVGLWLAGHGWFMLLDRKRREAKRSVGKIAKPVMLVLFIGVSWGLLKIWLLFAAVSFFSHYV